MDFVDYAARASIVIVELHQPLLRITKRKANTCL